ncbi:tryptophan synthase beta subunit-like PLP-dependent enzyme [Catenaria anguillulae PL171]|uniref:cysteine synthase n=1 Tax=Catenaria anguillulae PL171 TaxID=765915 RepID=A0A1Y2I372_9FUNG|nr:tryptophan synthase beta subunit-like PLP-dependent enzyme [Catenaria anguillulae PL171]
MTSHIPSFQLPSLPWLQLPPLPSLAHLDGTRLQANSTATLAVATAASAAVLYYCWPSSSLHTPSRQNHDDSLPSRPSLLPAHRGLDVINNGVADLVGNTPLIRLTTLSDLTGCDIYGKAEYLNPGGSSKDRVALSILRSAASRGLLRPGGTVYEGTVGSTGISLALMCRALGYRAHIVMPDDVARDKVDMLERLGATVERVRPVSIIDANHFVNLARRRAQEDANGVFADQFENLDNVRVHLATTGPEIVEQTEGGRRLDAFVMGAGTGGTLAGVARCVKRAAAALGRHIQVVLADPQGSGLFNKVKFGVLYAPTEAEGTRRRHQVDTVVEGIGLNRLTSNFAKALPFVDDAVRVTDQEAVDMARYLMLHEGLFVGSSSAVNVVAAVRVAKRLGAGKTVVTLLCDSGTRHLSKFWNDEYLSYEGLEPRQVDKSFIEGL